MENNFKEFTKPGKAAWLAQIRKDLKNQPLEELLAVFGPGLEIDPFLHEDDRIDLAVPMSPSATSNAWLISELIEDELPEKINSSSLRALEGGASALHLKVAFQWTQTDFEKAFEGIYIDYVFIHWECLNAEVDPQSFFSDFSHYLSQKDIAPESVMGSLEGFRATDQQNYGRLPGFRNLCFKENPGPVADQLAALLIAAEHFLNTAENPGELANAFVFELNADADFYLSIAKIRAFKLAWKTLTEAYGTASYAFIRALIRNSRDDTDPNTQVIQASAQGLALSIGGADLIEIEPFAYDKAEFGDDFPGRIARNIQHILQLESFTDKVTDPAGGSYFMDHLTQKLAFEVWEKFKAHFKEQP